MFIGHFAKNEEPLEKTQRWEWGIFSRGIPGRVGYQCAHYYRELVRLGVLSNANAIKGTVMMKMRDEENDRPISKRYRIPPSNAQVKHIEPAPQKYQITERHAIFRLKILQQPFKSKSDDSDEEI